MFEEDTPKVGFSEFENRSQSFLQKLFFVKSLSLAAVNLNFTSLTYIPSILSPTSFLLL